MRRMPGRMSLVGLVAGTTVVFLGAAAPGIASASGGSHLPPGAQRQIDHLKPHAVQANSKARALEDDGDDGDGDGGEDPSEIADQAAQYAMERIAPATVVPPAALPAARAAAAALASTGGSWRQLTHQPYNAEPDGYVDKWKLDGCSPNHIDGLLVMHPYGWVNIQLYG